MWCTKQALKSLASLANEFKTVKTAVFSAVFTSHVIKTKNRNHSINKFKRIWHMIDNYNINNLTKNQVSAVFYSRAMRRSVSPKFIELCMEAPCLCPSVGQKHGGRDVTRTSVVEFAIEMKIFTLGLWHIEINASFTARTVKLAKTKAIAHLLNYAPAFSCRHFMPRNEKAWQFKRAL